MNLEHLLIYGCPKLATSAWETRRNRERASINWMFDVGKARTKLHRAYDKLTGQN